MSIYAKTNMEAMPGSCTECKCGDRYGCVGDVKCRILQKYFTGNVEPPYKERPDECPLVEQLKPPNAPLTLEELREMDGEPVFLETGMVDIREQIIAEWDILVEHDEDCFFFTRKARGFLSKNYGKTWLACRRRPEEGDEHGTVQV